MILTLLAQSLVPGVAVALRAEPGPAQTVLICTGDGIKQVALDQGGAERAPHARSDCPCCVLCATCALPVVGRIGVRVAYAVGPAFRVQSETVGPIAMPAPPRHRPRAPPSSS